MTNMRLIYENAAKTTNTITASTTAGTLSTANLQNDDKKSVWRATTTSGTLTAIWTAAQTINAVALPFCNLTSSATMRVRGYTNLADGSPAFDTTALACCAYVAGAFKNTGVAYFDRGGGVYVSLFFTGSAVKKLVIDLADSTNAAGYIEAGCLVIGDYWQPDYNPDWGLGIGWKDLSTHERSDNGSPKTDIKPRHKTISMSLSSMSETDKTTMLGIMRNWGVSNPIYFCLFPDAPTQDNQIYGKLSQLGQLSFDFINRYKTSIEIEEI